MSDTSEHDNPSPMRPQPIEPLRDFSTLAEPLAVQRDQLSQSRGKLAARIASAPANTVESLRVRLTYTSNALEGNTLTLRETQLVIEGISPGGKPLREIYETRNHYRALLDIERRAAQANPFTEEDLLAIHRVVLADIHDAAAGGFRDQRVRIVGSSHVPPSSHKFPQLIPMLIEFANDARVHPVLRAAELHYNLTVVHPFIDGNGRTSRLAMNHLLLMNGYPMTYFEVEKRQQYLESLEAADRGDPAPFTSLVLARVEHSMQYLTS